MHDTRTEALAHDLNNLLMIVSGCCERLASDGQLAARQRGDLERIALATSHASALTAQMLPAERRRSTPAARSEAHAVITRAVRLLKPEIGGHIGIETHLSPEDAWVALDESALTHVLINLAINARDAMPEGGVIAISTELVTRKRDGAHENGSGQRALMLEVRDGGSGMPPEVAARAFEPFFTTKAAGHGTGLGLASVRWAVEQGGGTVTIDSTEGQGSRFVITLPVTPPPESIDRTGRDRSGPVEAPPALAATDRFVLDALPAPSFIVRQQQFVYVNQAFADLLLLTPADLEWHDTLERVHPDDRQVALHPLTGANTDAASTRHASTQLRVRRGDGAERSVQVLTALTTIGRHAALLGTATDISVPPDAATMAVRMAALGRLAGGVAHDLNNLLLVLRGQLDYLRVEVTGTRGQRALDTISAAADRATLLTDRLLSFGRRQMLSPRALDLATLLEDLAPALGERVGEGIDISLDVAVGLPRIRVDEARLQEVFAHLADNARDAMPDGGRLEISADRHRVDDGLQARWSFLSADGEYVRVRVADTGEGMNQAVVPHAFEPFFTTKARTRGTGMGLASVYGIVKQSGGYVFIERTGHEGTCMTLLFPAVIEEREAASTSSSAITSAPASRSDPRVLLVEDDPGVRELLEDVLGSHGFDVVTAGTAEEAETHAAAAPVDVLLTDIDLPGMNGARLSKTLAERDASLRVVLMSGYPDDRAIAEAGLHERPVVLRKPFSPAQLLAVLRDVLST